MKKLAVVVAVLAALLVALVVICPATVLPACESEDSHFCYWDAGAHGNGVGSSFIDLGGIAVYI